MDRTHNMNSIDLVKIQIIKFIEEKDPGEHIVKSINLVNTFQFEDESINCFQIRTSNIKYPNWIMFVSNNSNSNIPNAIYNEDLFNPETLKEMQLNITHAVFNFHIGTMIYGISITRRLLDESKDATKH